MAGESPVQYLLTAGSIAALVLFLLCRRLPLPANFALGLVAITAITTTTPTMASSAILPLVTGSLRAVGMAGDRAGAVLDALTAPAESLLGNHVSHIVAVCADISFWALLQVVGVAAVVACVSRMPLPSGFEHLRAAFEQRWPAGGHALLITVLAVLLLMAAPVAAMHWQMPITTTRGIVVALLFVLRIWQPRLVSWGAWMLGMIVLPKVVLQQILYQRTVLTGVDLGLLAAAADAVSALLILTGPRRDLKSGWSRLLCVLVFVVPGLGWLARPLFE